MFVETSALLQVLFNEPGFVQTEKLLAQADWLLASRLIRLESERAVLRVSQSSEKPDRIRAELMARLNAFWPRFEFIEMSAEICHQAGRIAPEAPLRTLDAIHVATYFWIKSQFSDVHMLSFDKQILAMV